MFTNKRDAAVRDARLRELTAEVRRTRAQWETAQAAFDALTDAGLLDQCILELSARRAGYCAALRRLKLYYYDQKE